MCNSSPVEPGTTITPASFLSPAGLKLRLLHSTTGTPPALSDPPSSWPMNTTTINTHALLLWKPNTRRTALPPTSLLDNGEPHGSLLTLLTQTLERMVMTTTGLNSTSPTVARDALPFPTGPFPESVIKPLSTSTTVSSFTSPMLVLKELPPSLPGKLLT